MDITLPTYIDESIRERLHKVIVTVTEHLPEEPVEAFISTGLSQGQSNYLGVWLFTAKLAVEIRNPLNQRRIQYDMFSFANAIDWIRLNARNYAFGDPVENSQLDLEFSTVDAVSSVLSASGEGCRELMRIYKDRFLPNFADDRDRD